MSTERIVLSNGLRLCTESLGNHHHTACLLISGAGASAKFWSDVFCADLVNAGYFVIRYDHRDQGLSDEVDWEKNPYTVDDLAKDAIAILDAYQIEKAHIIGHSMGGIIAQLLAIKHPDRLLSFTSLSVSTVGEAGTPSQEVMNVLMENKPTQNYEKDLPGFMKSWLVLNGSFVLDEAMATFYTHDLYSRSKHKMGVAWNHIRAQKLLGDLSQALRENKIPALFIHGEVDPLIPVQGAKDTAKATAHSQLMIISGMGHMFFNRELEKKISECLLKHLTKIN